MSTDKKEFEIAKLTVDQLETIVNLENELGLTLVAYEPEKLSHQQR
jgi:hypothetical protein